MTESHLEEVLAKTGFVILSPEGESMRPMLRAGRDTVLIKPPTRPLKRGDVILYRRERGDLVLHRLLRCKDGSCTCLGDAQLEKEHGIRLEQVIGILEGFYRGERFYLANALRFRIYGALWGRNLCLRKAVHCLLYPVRLLRRVGRRCFRREK